MHAPDSEKTSVPVGRTTGPEKKKVTVKGERASPTTSLRISSVGPTGSGTSP
ncbi:MAG: hypothetical protein ACK51Z_00925 [Pseudomonadota bacterium]